jgi:hypothetical protein
MIFLAATQIVLLGYPMSLSGVEGLLYIRELRNYAASSASASGSGSGSVSSKVSSVEGSASFRVPFSLIFRRSSFAESELRIASSYEIVPAL